MVVHICRQAKTNAQQRFIGFQTRQRLGEESLSIISKYGSTDPSRDRAGKGSHRDADERRARFKTARPAGIAVGLSLIITTNTIDATHGKLLIVYQSIRRGLGYTPQQH